MTTMTTMSAIRSTMTSSHSLVLVLAIICLAIAAAVMSSDPSSVSPSPSSSTIAASSSSSVRHVLVTGGLGYIGSHTVVRLLLAGYHVTIVDNLVNSNRIVLSRIAALTPECVQPTFHNVDCANEHDMTDVFNTRKFDACIHFAGLKSVGESVREPLLYYSNNLISSLTLFRLLKQYGCKNIVFSSSATVYGLAEVNPIPETAPLSTTNPYGQTKLVIEGMLRDLGAAPLSDAAKSAGEAEWKIVILRYFNPIGAHESGTIGEDPLGIPNNLLPFVMQVAVGRRAEVSVFGGDYDTRDGTGVRDYIHVEDLATGHLAAIEHGIFGDALGGKTVDAFNLGSGVGVSVLEMIAAAEVASGRAIPYKINARRTGDIATCFADAAKAEAKLHWKVEKTLQQAVSDSWRWQKANPEGFNTVKKD